VEVLTAPDKGAALSRATITAIVKQELARAVSVIVAVAFSRSEPDKQLKRAVEERAAKRSQVLMGTGLYRRRANASPQAQSEFNFYLHFSFKPLYWA
jgi:hypothetical protein